MESIWVKQTGKKDKPTFPKDKFLFIETNVCCLSPCIPLEILAVFPTLVSWNNNNNNNNK